MFNLPSHHNGRITPTYYRFINSHKWFGKTWQFYCNSRRMWVTTCLFDSQANKLVAL